ITTLGLSVFLPHEEFTKQICTDFNDLLATNFCNKVFIGGSVQETLENPQAVISLCIFLAGMATAICLIIYFGKQIDLTVSLSSLSDMSTNLHKKTLKILIVQMFIPFVFIYFPIAVHILSMIIYINTMPVTFILSYFLVIFPLANAASHLYFIKDYRAFVFGIIFRPLIKIAG
ncbi:hypothetical protein PENTCL1PPCAC_11880, partial [Pristionchus entomophagus]